MIKFKSKEIIDKMVDEHIEEGNLAVAKSRYEKTSNMAEVGLNSLVVVSLITSIVELSVEHDSTKPFPLTSFIKETLEEDGITRDTLHNTIVFRNKFAHGQSTDGIDISVEDIKKSYNKFVKHIAHKCGSEKLLAFII